MDSSISLHNGRAEWHPLSRLATVLAVGLAVWALPRPLTVDPRAWRLLAIFIATILGIITKPLPIGAVAIIALAATVLTRTLTIGEALSGFGNPTVWLVVAAFSIATGFIKTGLGTRIAYRLLTVFGRSTLGVGYSLVATDLVLALAIASNTARAGGVIFPILQSLSRTATAKDPAAGRLTSAFLTLTAYQGTVITSAMFLTAMVANPLAAQLAADQGVTISWTTWAMAGIVPGLVSLVVMPLVVYRLCPPGVAADPEAPAQARAALARLGPMTRAERTMAAVALALIAAWIFGSVIQLDPSAAALLAIAALLMTGVLQWDDIVGERDGWNTLVWFGTLVMMAAFLGQLGLIKWFSGQVSALFAGLNWVTGFLGLGLIYFYSHYFFASSTAHISAMFAPFLAAMIALGTPPALAALVLSFFSNLFACLTHYGTAPGPILFGSGHVTLGTWWKTGAVLSVVHIVIWLGIGTVWWRMLGLW